MFRLRPTLFFPALVTAGVLALLWVPILQLYGPALLQIVAQDPARLMEALPISPVPQTLFLNTMYLCAGTAVLALFLGTVVATFLAQPKRHPVAAILFVLPLAVSPTLMATAYLEISRTPPARAAASLAADSTLAFSSIFVAAPVLALCFYPLVAFAVAAARRFIPQELVDAARLFGNGWSSSRRVLWPLLAPAALASAGLVAALSMWEMGAPDLLDVRTYSVQIYRDFSAMQNTPKAALDALPMFVLGALCFFPAWRALRFYQAMDTAFARPLATAPVSWIAAPAALLVWTMSPLAPLIVFVSEMQPRHILWTVWHANRDEIVNTFAVATIASCAIVAVGSVVVAAWQKYSLRAQRLLLFLVLTPLLCAPIMLAIASLQFFNQPLFDVLYESRYGLLTCGLLVRFLPLGVLWIYQAWRAVPRQYEEAASNLGAAGATVRATIVAPLLAPALLGLLAVCWALCATELSLSVLLNAPGGQPLPVPIFNQMHIGATAEVAALSLTLVAMSAGVLGALLLATNFYSQRHRLFTRLRR